MTSSSQEDFEIGMERGARSSVHRKEMEIEGEMDMNQIPADSIVVHTK